MRARVLPLCAAGLIVIACGSSPQQPPESPAATDTAATGTPGAADGSDGDAPGAGGTMIVTYQDATSPDAVAGRDLMQGVGLLENFADDINQTLNLPYDIALHGTQCDEPNAYWSEGDTTITICYEDAFNSRQIFTDAGDVDPDAAAINAEYATFYHEVGHMAISVYDLPVTGREEDVADQLAAYILLSPDEDGQIDPESVQAVKDFARTFDASGEDTTEVDSGALADEHSLDMQRVYNLDCWIYGSDPVANNDLVTSGQLPEDRADGCPGEWEQLDKAWSTLLDPYLK